MVIIVITESSSILRSFAEEGQEALVMRKIFREAANRRGCRRILSILLAAVLCFGMATPAMAADKAKTIRLMTTEGTVVVTNSSGESQTIWEEMRLYSGWHVITGAESYAYLRLDDSKGVKLDASTEVEVRSRGRKLELLVDSGNIYFGVSAPLESDETLNIRTSTMAMGIRGTSGWVDAVEEGRSRIHILEGVVTGTVTDPVSGQSKSTTIHGGEYADFYTYDASVPGDKVAITRGTFDRGDISGYVLKELVGQDELIEKIYDDSGIDLRDLTYAAAAAVQASDEAAARAAAASQVPAAQEAVEPYETDAEKTPVWSVGGSGGGDGGSAGSYTSPEVIVIRETETVEVPGTYTLSASGTDFLLQAATGGKVAANDDGTYKVEGSNSGTDVRLTLTPAEGYMVAEKDDVTVYHGTTALSGFTAAEGEPGSITGTANISKDTALSVDGLYYKVTDMDSLTAALASHDRVVLTKDLTLAGDLTIPSGKTLVVFTGNTVRIDANAVLQIEGTLVNKGMIENYGTIANRSAHTLLNEGTITNYGDIENGDGDEEGRIVNEGVITNDGDAAASITNAPGSAIENSGSIENSGNATINNAGRLENTGSGTIANTGAITNGGDLVNDGAITGRAGVIDSTDGNLITTTDAVNENEVEEPENGGEETKAGHISTAVIGKGSLTANKQTAGAGEKVSLAATPDSGYELTSLLALSALDGTKRTITDDAFTMPEGDVIVIAVFSEKAEEAEEPEAAYNVIIPEADNGTVEASQTSDLAGGERITLTATPDSGYQSAGLSVFGVDGTLISTGSTFTMPKQDVLVVASFEALEDAAEVQYAVSTFVAEGGSLEADLAKAKAGEAVTLTATAAEGCAPSVIKVVSASSGRIVTLEDDNSFTMPAGDVVAFALFTKVSVPAETYRLTIAETANGTVSADRTEAEADVTVVLTVTPNEGFELESLTVTDKNGNAVTMTSASTFTMPPSDVTVTATFQQIGVTPKYSITVNGANNGSVKADADESIAGLTVVLTVTPNEGYELDSLTVGDTEITVIPGNTTYTFKMPPSNVTVTATFKEIVVYTVSVAGLENGAVTANPTKSAEGQTVVLTVEPDEGYELASLTVNDSAITVIPGNTTYTFKMPPSNVTVSATFKEKTYTLSIALADNGYVVASDDGTGDEWEITEGETISIPAGETVLLGITPTPIDQYALQSLFVVGTSSGELVTVENEEFTMPAEDVIVIAVFEETGYRISIPGRENGFVYIKQSNNRKLINSVEGWTFPDAEITAPEGEIVCLHIVPACVKDENNEIEIPIDFTHQLKSLVVMDEHGHTINDLTEVFLDDDIGLYYQFTMPAANVIVLADFAPINEDPGAGRDFVVTGGIENEDYTYKDGVLTIRKTCDLTISNTVPNRADFGDRIVVDVTDYYENDVNITMNDLFVKPAYGPALSITEETVHEVHIYLIGCNRLMPSNNGDFDTISKNNDRKLYIEGTQPGGDGGTYSPPFLFAHSMLNGEGAAIYGHNIEIRYCAVELKGAHSFNTDSASTITIGGDSDSVITTTAALKDLPADINIFNEGLNTLILLISDDNTLLNDATIKSDDSFDYLLPRIYECASNVSFTVSSPATVTFPGDFRYDPLTGKLNGSLEVGSFETWQSGSIQYTTAKGTSGFPYSYRILTNGLGTFELTVDKDGNCTLKTTPDVTQFDPIFYPDEFPIDSVILKAYYEDKTLITITTLPDGTYAFQVSDSFIIEINFCSSGPT